MAIINTVPGLEVSIEVAGKPLREFDVPQDSKDIDKRPALKRQTWAQGHLGSRRRIYSGYVAKYIAVESGTYPCVQFAKAANFLYEGHHIAYSVRFDDTSLKLRHQPPGFLYDSWEDGTDSVVVGTEREQSSKLFRFANLDRVDETYGDIGYAKTSNVGSIRIIVYHMKSHRCEIDKAYNYKEAPRENIMSEVNMKNREFSHCIEVEDGNRIDEPEPEYEDDFLDDEELPFAIYDFFYRSQDALIKLGVRTQEEVEEEEEEKMSREELKAKLRHIRNKRKRDESEDRKPAKRFKHEPMAFQIKTK
ncbi:hypothetical protein F5Y10DRAFT_264920 [Nemania abortiva]|nr:hypothetical protein F5Y10DRAFT_264920 [Nemania abortiva]